MTKLKLENKKLKDLGILTSIQWEGLIEVDLHKNLLSSIDILNQFRNLRIIKASDNYVREVNLNLQKLEELDLHNNYIEKFPHLHQLPKIMHLNLNTNNIIDFRVDIKPPSSNSLISLDLGNNKLQFNSDNDFMVFMDKLKKIKNLKSLILVNNPFVKDKDKEDRFDQILKYLSQIEWFNYERADDARSKISKDQADQPKKEKKGKKGKTKVDKNLLCYHLDAANSHPSYAIDHLKDLAEDVDVITEHIELVDEFFAPNKMEEEINDMIETFMQNSQLLIDNHYELQNIMLSILAKLSSIKFQDFGIRCFNTLRDLMIAGEEMEERVIEVLKKEVINKLQQQNPEQISAPLLRGLYELVEKTGKSDMLSALFENCFPTWLRTLYDKIDNANKFAVKFGDNENFDSIIALLASAVKDNDENVKKCVDKDLTTFIANIINESNWEQKRYINCLRIIENLSAQNQKAADKFLDKKVHQNLLRNIKNSLNIYKKNNELTDEESKDTEDTIKLKYLTLAAEIDCIGGILHKADKQKAESLIKDNVLDEILQIASHYKTDPVLLTAICKFAKQLFSRNEMKTSQHLLEQKVKKMNYLVQLTPYLGGKKYDDLLKMSKRYYDSNAFAEKDKATLLQHLDDLVVQRLFIAIIQLINFFCEEAEADGSSSIFEDVSKELNKANREQALFNSLEVPNDEVKLAVVECLNNVPLSEFDNEEIATIIRLLGSYKNIGAGKTEYVLAKIFWILTKLTKEKEENSGKEFRFKYGERAIKEAMEILIKNLQRPVANDEENEKLALSLSCLHFLKFASDNAELKRFMLAQHEDLKKALRAEEINTSYKFSKFPIEIENTWLGRSIDVLMHTMTGTLQDSIRPFNYVSFRVIQRMADILMDELDTDVEDPFNAGNDVIEELMRYYRQSLRSRKKKERTYWKDIPEDFLSMLKRNQENYEMFFKSHMFFTSHRGIPNVKMFLTKRVPEYEHYLKNIYSKSFETEYQYISTELKKTKISAEEKERKKQREEEKKGKTIQRKDSDDEQNLGPGLNILQMALQQEELGQNYDPEQNQDHLIQLVNKDNANQENIKKRDHKFGVQNLKQRSLCVAAYLRCLYASIEYAPQTQYKIEAIQQLKVDYAIKNLTQLCDTTGWLEAAIGAKYLRIMNHVIKVPFNESREDDQNLQLYSFISTVVKKILHQVLIMIKNEQQKPLSEEHIVLIYELASICNVMCRQCNLFKWSDVEVYQPGVHCRTRRSPQEKILDRQISILFPSQSIKTFIAIIFRDMKISSRIFKQDNVQNSEIEEMNEFIKRKNDLAREQIKLFLGEYLSKCKDNKYDVLEALMKGVVYEKQELRDSFLQEILKAQVKTSYRDAIENFIREKNYSFVEGENERIMQIDWVEVATETSKNFKSRLMVMTNKGIHIFRGPASKPCSVCPPENLCPDGPRPEIKFEYDSINEFITFQDIPQKLVIKFYQNKGLMQRQQSATLSLIIPQYISAIQVLSLIKEVRNYENELQDKLVTGSILHYAEEISGTKNNHLVLAKYVSFNPSKGLFSFSGGGENLIQNCCLLAVTVSQEKEKAAIMVLKENWNKWTFVDDEDKIEKAFEDQNQYYVSQVQKDAQDKLKASIKGMFTPLLKRQLAQVSNMQVHKGKDPAVDLVFEKGKIDKIIFLSDYCRQQFVETLVAIKRGKYSFRNLKKKDQEFDDSD